MGNTHASGVAARETNYRLHGRDFYARIGAIGGRARNPKKGFGSYPELAQITGKVYGHMSGPGRKMDARRKRELNKTYLHLRKIHERAMTQQRLLKAPV